MIQKFSLLFLAGITASQIVAPFSVARAQTNATQVLELSPFLQELSVEKGATTETVIDVTNRSEVSLRVGVEARDFLPGEEGQPYFVPDTELNDTTFSLAAWIRMPSERSVLLEPGEKRTLVFAITPPKDAEQGTHYGAILFSYNAGDLPSGVAVTQSVGTILLLEYGQARAGGTLSLQSSEKVLFTNNKITFTNTFANIGNVHAKPKGEVYIKNMWGQTVSTVFVNRDANVVLPKSNRVFIGSWYPSVLSFGRYKAESVLTYGRERLEVRESVVVWVLPWYLLVVLGFVLTMIAWFIVHGRHWHRRRVIQKHLAKQ